MIKFSVELTKVDLKNFIFYKLRKKMFSLLIQPVVYFLAAFILFILGFWFNFGVTVWSIMLMLLSLSFWFFYKIFIVFKQLFVKSLILVGKPRNFIVDERNIIVLCENNSELCGRYFFYNLNEFTQNSIYFFLIFKNNVYIIIPKRCLSSKNIETIELILNKNKN